MHTRRILPAIAVSILIAVLALSGCSEGLHTSTRSASGVSPTVCPEKSSWTIHMPIRNFLPDPVTFGASDVDCYDWSGVSNPITTFDGSGLVPGQKGTFRLEPRDNVDRAWEMHVSVAGSSVGSARFFIPSRTFDALHIDSHRATMFPRWTSDGNRTESDSDYDMGCAMAPLAPTTTPATSYSRLLELKSQGSGDPWKVGIASYDGMIVLAQCAVAGSQEWDGF